ncbi:MAG: class I SAM-dependent methyltransferase [Azospirillaceae bacterium]
MDMTNTHPGSGFEGHHHPAAALWDAGGAAYDRVSFCISDALAHAAQRLDPKPGEEILDIATGTGWSARNVARAGAAVTAVDIAPTLLNAAMALSAGIEPPIRYEQAAAEHLPFADAAFDGVISTFGVMFAADARMAASEMARVVRPGGRMALAVWVPAGAVAKFFAMIAAHDDGPPPPTDPLDWGDPARLAALLGDAFELSFEPGTSHAYHPSLEQIWDWYAAGFGPVRHLMARLDEAGLARLRADFDAYHRAYLTPHGLTVARDYLVVTGRRR